MLTKWLVLLVLLLAPGLAQATTYYISPTGSDAAAGTSMSVPWKTWSKAYGASTSCGDTLLVMDGTFTTATHGNGSLTRVCTVGNEFTIRAINQRVPLVSNSGGVSGGLASGLQIINSAYITVDGLRIKAADNAAGDGNSQPMRVVGSNHMILKNLLLYESNRMENAQMLNVSASDHVLVEDVEIYKFHRHGLGIGSGSTFITVRRLYCHSRSWADIAGGYVSSTTWQGESCVAIYPGNDNILENVIAESSLSITEINAASTGGVGGYGRRNQVLGSIALGARSNSATMGYGIILDNRGTTTANQVQNTTVRNNVWLNVGGSTPFGGYGIDVDGTLNTQIFNTTAINALLYGFYASAAPAASSGGGLYSYFCTNCLAIGNDNTGFLTTDQDTWTITNANAYQNGTNYSPSSSANYTPSNPPSAVDPQMANCYLWAPDGSTAQSNNWGATILYKYKDSVLQDGTGGTVKSPLWDPTTNEFPHGAVIAGVNDVAGQSLFDVHERLHVGVANGCAFPSTYTAGTPPQNPAGLVTSQGTTSPSHARTITAGMDSITVGVALYDSGGNVGTVTGVTSSCGGGEALTQLATAVASPAYRRVYIFGKINPTAGSCTISATTTGTVVASVLLSDERDNISAYDDTATLASGSSLTSTPSVTVPTGANETVIDMLATKCGLSAGACTVSVTAGEDQTLQSSQGHLTLGDVRIVMSTQSGTTSGVMSQLLSLAPYNAYAAVALCPTAGCASASSQVLTQVAGQIDNAFMTGCPSACTVMHLGAVNAATVNIDAGTSFAVTLQTDCTTANCANAGRKLYFSRNSGAYVPLLDTETTGITFAGATADPSVVNGAISTNLSGGLTNIPGTTIDSASTTPTADMSLDSSLVNRWVVRLTANAVATHTYEFKEYTDAGVALDALNPATADAKVTVTGVPPVIAAPTSLRVAGIATAIDVTLIWAPNTYAAFAGYKVYRSTTSGVYGAVPVATITPASARLTNTPMTQWTGRIFKAGTYYFVVKAFDLDGNESAAATEVSLTLTGL